MEKNAITPFKKYREIEKRVQKEILSELDSYIIGTTVQELTLYYFDQYSLSHLLLDKFTGETASIKKEQRIHPAQKEGTIRNSGPLTLEYELVQIRIPIYPNPCLSLIKAFVSSCLTKSNFLWQQDQILISIEMKGYQLVRNEDEVQREVIKQKAELYSCIENINTQIINLNEALKTNIQGWIEARKEKLEADQERYNSLLKKIDIPLTRKIDEVITNIQLDVKPLIIRIKPTARNLEEYVIDQQKVLDVVHIIDNQGRQIENTPKSFIESGEYDLRNILLVGLNTVFEGAATGETFSAKGKTDIYLNINKGNILVFECKIWDGLAKHNETIDQLLSYLTWRNNYGILVIFSRKRGFTRVLEEVKKVIRNHSSYRSGLCNIDNSHFVSQHRLPSDEFKNVELHHLFYNLSI